MVMPSSLGLSLLCTRAADPDDSLLVWALSDMRDEAGNHRGELRLHLPVRVKWKIS
jgi:hypothetical protein